MWLPHSFLVLLLVVLASGSIINTTIDDSSSSFTFHGAWNTITPTSPCAGCSSQPDPSKTQDRTWHDGNIREGAPVGTSGSFTFTGSAVYIFGIDQTISQPNIAFTLGSIQQVHHYTGTERFVYDALFFSADGLAADQTHTVNWIFNVAPNTGVGVQAALFDYAIVTSGAEDVKTTSTPVITEQVPTQSSTPSNDAATTPDSSSSSAVSRNQIVSVSGVLVAQSTSGRSQRTSPITSPSDQSPSLSVTTISSSTDPHAAMPEMTTTTAQSASSRSKSNLGPIVGGVVGALAVVTLAISAWLYVRQVRRISPRNHRPTRSQFLRFEDYPIQSSLHRTSDTHEVGVPVSGFQRHTMSEAVLAGSSFVSLLSSPDGPSTTPPAASASCESPFEIEPPTAINTRPINSTTSSDFRFMVEKRLATLEAQAHPHVPGEDD